MILLTIDLFFTRVKQKKNIQSSENLTYTYNHIIIRQMYIGNIILKIFVTNIFIKPIIILFYIKHII